MKNICKFVTPGVYGQLTVSCFVMETDAEIMKKSISLKMHRAFLLIQGKGSLLIDGRSLPTEQGALVFAFEGEAFSFIPSEDAIYIYIDFGGGRADELFSRFKINSKNRHFADCDGLIPLWRDSLSRADADTADLASESILLYSFSRLHSQAARFDSAVSRILEISDKCFNDPELSIAVIAKQLSYNPKYLSHSFKKTTGVTFSDYLRDLRIKYAISLFNDGLDSVKNVALLSGYSDPLYFSNVFKRAVGISPREYVLKLQRTEPH